MPSESESLTTLGGRLKYARLRRGLKSRELSRLAGLNSESHTSRIERGREKVDVQIVAALARVLDVPLDWLVNGIGFPTGLPKDPPASSPEAADGGAAA